MKTNTMKKLNLSPKTVTLIALSMIAVGTASVFAYRNFISNDTKPLEEDSSIDFGPPDEEEKKAGDEQKRDIVEEKSKQSEPSSTKTANVVITDASQYGNQIEIRAFISNVYEDGTCTFTLTQGSNTFSKQTKGFKDATTTQCTPLSVPRSEFASPGTWSFTAKYSSASASGEVKGTVLVK